MAVLELVHPQPRWQSALAVALTRPAGVPERRAGEDPWGPADAGRPRRIADDLAWLRQAMEEPASSGLQPLDDEQALPLWEVDPQVDGRVDRLLDRGVLQAAGFLLHREDGQAEE
jgi:hypothetical protein